MAKYCNLWRNYDDIQDNWGSVRCARSLFVALMLFSGIIDYWGTANGLDFIKQCGFNITGADYDSFVNVARPGAWNDPDQVCLLMIEFLTSF